MSTARRQTGGEAATLDPERIRGQLSTPARMLLHHLEVFEQTDSTNTRLLEAAARGVAAGTAVVAAEQTAGRGRHGRRWFSPPGGSLSLSLLWDLPDLRAMAGLSLAAGVAAARALKLMGLRVGLKWPNDVVWEGRKLAGILVEGQGGERCVAVIGVGINLAFPEAMVVDQPFADLRSALGSPPPADIVAGGLLNELLLLLPGFQTEGRSAVFEEWAEYDVLKHRRIQVEQDGVAFTGTARGIDARGALLLETSRGVRSFGSGSLKVRLHDSPG